MAAGDSARWETLGGTIIQKAADTPFGRFGDVRDPMGAIFNVIGRIG
jgi:predicted enzyme related to lactoylglutathione lyase